MAQTLHFFPFNLGRYREVCPSDVPLGRFQLSKGRLIGCTHRLNSTPPIHNHVRT